MFRNHLIVTIFIYLILSGILIFFKPNLVFKKSTNTNFGVGSKKTLLPFWLALLLIGIISYILTIIIMMRFI